MMFSKYISGLMQNIAYPPEIKKDKSTRQVVLTFKDEESMIDFFKEVYKKGVRQGEDLGRLQERIKQ
jgi:hypothetical protein